MGLDALADRIPQYAKDLRLNLSSVLRQTELTEQQLWGTVVAAAIASRNADTIAAAAADAAGHLSPTALEAARSAAAIMGMNNIYYRFLHITPHEKYATIPARLRMNAIRTHGVDQVDFELWCVAVSAINNCQACVASHEKVVREKGLSEEAILASVRVASVIHAIATVLDAEAVTASSATSAEPLPA